MTTKIIITEPYCILASIGVSHQAFREIEGRPQMPSPAYFRIWKMPLIAYRVVGHRGTPTNSLSFQTPSSTLPSG